MISVEQAKNIAKKENKDSNIINVVQYKNYYVFFMQPKGIEPCSDDALLDNYVLVNFKTGKIEYRSIFEFDDFFDKSVKLSHG